MHTISPIFEDMVAFDRAQAIMSSAVPVLGSEYVSLSNTLGRVAAEDVVAEEDLVPYARSAMDGYALRASDTAPASPQFPVKIPITGKVFTGEGRLTLAAGTAMGITTGAPVPCNADAVVPYERVQVRDGVVFIEEVLTPGDCIFPPAEDVRRGETLLECGTVLRPAVIDGGPP